MSLHIGHFFIFLSVLSSISVLSISQASKQADSHVFIHFSSLKYILVASPCHNQIRSIANGKTATLTNFLERSSKKGELTHSGRIDVYLVSKIMNGGMEKERNF